jgi:EmrB/QacA subfamily drug resistance transporter
MARKWKVLAVVALGTFVGFLDVTIANIAFPEIAADFDDFSLSGLSWVLNGYAVIYAALLVPIGRLADMIGRRRVFLAGLALFTLFSVAAALAPTAEALIAARVLQGAAAAALVPTGLALLLPEFPAEQRATAVGIWGAVAAVSAALGPVLGGLIVEVADWRWVFAVNLPIGIAGFVAGARVLRESRDPDRRAVPDAVGAAMVALSVGLLSLGLVEGENWGWTSAEVLASFAGALLFGSIAIQRSRRHPAPVFELDLWRVRSFAVANAGMLLFSVAFYAMLFANVLFLVNVWDYDVLTAGLAIAPGPLTAMVFAVIAGPIADRRGQRAVLVPGTLLFAASMGWAILVAGTDSNYAGVFLPAMFVGGAGVGLTYPALSSAAAASLPPARFATGAALNMTARQVGAVLGVALVVATLGTPSPADAMAAFDRAWAVSGVAAALAALVTAMLGRVTVAEPTPEAVTA